MLIRGDARMLPVRSDSIQCVVTSPPYWGLRDYGTARWEGGDEECSHKQGRNGSGRADGIVDERGQRNRDGVGAMGGDCGKCGAKRIDTQLGLEATPEAYVAEMVAVFREVWRVLRKDGTVWLNLGDSYAGGNQTGRNDNGRPEKGRGWAEYDIRRTQIDRRDGLKPKNLVGIPWRVAFALQADGWYLRSDIIWAKPNPMPESVTDRPTKAHEYVFLLAKSERYYYDADAIAEESIKGAAGSLFHTGKTAIHQFSRSSTTERSENGTRNARSVWTIATDPYSGAHFAVFPAKLIEPMILAGSRPGDLVLDPFVGSGTVVMVARGLGRRGLGVDLRYQDLSAARVHGPLFAPTINS